MSQHFEELLKSRLEAANAWVSGEVSLLEQIETQTSPATFFAPGGDIEQGAEQVRARYRRDAGNFASGTTDLEILHKGEGGDFAYWVGVQRGVAKLHGEDQAFTLLVTEIFKLEAGAWKLIHRHASSRQKL